jgi:hypothetical protein
MFYGDAKSTSKFLSLISTKTQFAGSAAQKIIIHLLKYLNEKYL